MGVISIGIVFLWNSRFGRQSTSHFRENKKLLSITNVLTKFYFLCNNKINFILYFLCIYYNYSTYQPISLYDPEKKKNHLGETSGEKE